MKGKKGTVDIISMLCFMMYCAIVVAIIIKPSHPELLQLQDKMNPILLTILAGYFGENITMTAMKPSRVSKKFKDVSVDDDDESLNGFSNHNLLSDYDE